MILCEIFKNHYSKPAPLIQAHVYYGFLLTTAPTFL